MQNLVLMRTHLQERYETQLGRAWLEVRPFLYSCKSVLVWEFAGVLLDGDHQRQKGRVGAQG